MAYKCLIEQLFKYISLLPTIIEPNENYDKAKQIVFLQIDLHLIVLSMPKLRVDPLLSS